MNKKRSRAQKRARKTKFSFRQGVAARARLSDYRGGTQSWVKSLTELITNSHVAYLKQPRKRSGKKPREIRIVADQRAETFEVFDGAGGLAADEEELKDRIGSYSKKHADSHTAQTRSMFGRGLSDVLFRNHDSEALLMSRRGNAVIGVTCKWVVPLGGGEPEPTVVADIDDRQVKQELSNSGTYVKFRWDSSKESQPFPEKHELIGVLRKYYELKNILSDPSFKVILEYRDRHGDVTKEQVQFFSCLKDPIGETFPKTQLNIPGYNIHVLSAEMYKAKVALNQDRNNEERTGGLYIEGEHGQVFDLTLFGQEDGNPDITQYLTGRVILSGEAKTYFQDEYDKGNQVIKKTREGFQHNSDFYKELKRKLDPWIRVIIAAEGKDQQQGANNDFGVEGIKELNKLAAKLLGEKTVVHDTMGTGPAKKVPDIMAFASNDYKIVEGASNRITLLMNPKKFSKKAVVEFWSNDTEFKVAPKKSKIDESDLAKDVVSIPVTVKCSIVDAESFIYAEAKDLSGKRRKVKANLTCVAEGEDWTPTNYLEFSPPKVTVRPDQPARAYLWIHSNVIGPGSEILLEYTATAGDGSETDVKFDNPAVPPKGDANQAFEFKVTKDDEVQDNGYIRRAITFVGKRDGAKGTLRAGVKKKHSGVKIPDAECEIEIKGKEGGGLLSGWDAEPSELPRYAFYRDRDRKIIFNLSNPLVQAVLSKDRDTAISRCKLYQEAAMFVANGILDVFLEYVLLRAFKDNKISFKPPNPSWEDGFKQVMTERQKIMRESGSNIITKFVPNCRSYVPLGGVAQMTMVQKFPKLRDYKVDWWRYSNGSARESTALGDVGTAASLQDEPQIFGFKYEGTEFEVAVNQKGGQILASLYGFDGLDKRSPSLHLLTGVRQVYSVAKKVPYGVPSGCAWSPVTVAQLSKEGSVNEVTIEPIDADKILDSPVRSVFRETREQSSNWIEDSKPLVYYRSYKKAGVSKTDPSLSDKLVCFVPKERTDVMALNFVRTKVLPIISSL